MMDGFKHLTERVTAVASLTCVQVVIDHTMPTPLQRLTKLKILHWYFLISVFAPSRLHLLSKTSWASVSLRDFFTHIHLMRRLSSMVNLIAVTTLFLRSGLHRCYQRMFKKNTNYCCQSHHFISYFVWNFHSNWLLFLRVVQENKSGCFSEHSVYISTEVALVNPVCNHVPMSLGSINSNSSVI